MTPTIKKKLSNIEKTLSELYYSASVSYDDETKTITVRLRTKMAFSMAEWIGTHYINIPVVFSKIDGVTLKTCKRTKVYRTGQEYNETEVNPSGVFDPGVSPNSVVKDIVKYGKFTSRTLKFVDIRHVSY